MPESRSLNQGKGHIDLSLSMYHSLQGKATQCLRLLDYECEGWCSSLLTTTLSGLDWQQRRIYGNGSNDRPRITSSDYRVNMALQDLTFVLFQCTFDQYVPYPTVVSFLTHVILRSSERKVEDKDPTAENLSEDENLAAALAEDEDDFMDQGEEGERYRHGYVVDDFVVSDGSAGIIEDTDDDLEDHDDDDAWEPGDASRGRTRRSALGDGEGDSIGISTRSTRRAQRAQRESRRAGGGQRRRGVSVGEPDGTILGELKVMRRELRQLQQETGRCSYIGYAFHHGKSAIYPPCLILSPTREVSQNISLSNVCCTSARLLDPKRSLSNVLLPILEDISILLPSLPWMRSRYSALCLDKQHTEKIYPRHGIHAIPNTG